MDIFNYQFFNDEKNLTILFGVDKNNDGKFDEYKEPTLINIVDVKTNAELQKTLD